MSHQEPPVDLETTGNSDLKAIKEAYEPSCVKCDKFATCFIWREFNQTIKSGYSDEKQSPVKVLDLAKICFQYYEKKKEKVNQ